MKRQELIDFLLAAEKQHVNDLIDILTDFGKGRVALNSTVKNVLISAKESSRPFRRKDVDLLLFEFQKYGGNTIVNVMRSKDSLVPYREILDDVFKLLIGGEDQFTDEQKERKIVEKLFSGEWKCMSFSERYEKSIDMVNIIKKNVIGGGVGNSFINFGLKILTRTNPVGVLTNFVLEPVHDLAVRGESADRDGLQGANRRRALWPGEDLQRRRAPDSALFAPTDRL